MLSMTRPLTRSTTWFLCQAVSAFENFAPYGHYLTTDGFDIGGRPEGNISYSGNDRYASQAHGAFESAGGSEPSYTLGGRSEYYDPSIVHATADDSPVGIEDVWMSGFVGGGRELKPVNWWARNPR